MVPRSAATSGASPLEMVLGGMLFAAIAGVGVLWAVGVVVGSLFGATLPGSAGEGMAAMLASFPDLGRAWQPPIPSLIVWLGVALVITVFAPLGLRLARIGRLEDEGARWATPGDLRRSGLLVPDGVAASSVPEAPLTQESRDD
ncbi:MAG: hypothetical protein ACRDVL_00610 [Acidimicrobiia bacterium]